MKNFKIIVFALFAGLALTSCTEMYLKKYESACKDGDATKAAVYAGKLVGKKLSAEQEQRAEKAALILLQKETGEINLNLQEEADEIDLDLVEEAMPVEAEDVAVDDWE